MGHPHSQNGDGDHNPSKYPLLQLGLLDGNCGVDYTSKVGSIGLGYRFEQTGSCLLLRLLFQQT